MYISTQSPPWAVVRLGATSLILAEEAARMGSRPAKSGQRTARMTEARRMLLPDRVHARQELGERVFSGGSYYLSRGIIALFGRNRLSALLVLGQHGVGGPIGADP